MTYPKNLKMEHSPAARAYVEATVPEDKDHRVIN